MGRPLGFRRRDRAASDRVPDRAVCDDLAQWSASWPSAERVVVAPSLTVSRALPRTTQPDVDPSFAPLCSVPVPEQALVQIPGAMVRTGSRGQHIGIVVLPDGQVVGETVALTPQGRRRMLRDLPAYREPLPDRPTRRPGDYFALVGFGAHHYYHWCHDLVMGACDVAHLLPADTTLVVPSGLRQFQTETLALLGLDGHPVLELPMDACWELERLYVVTPRLKTQIDHTRPFAWFRDAVMDHFGLEARAPTRLLHVSRRDDNHWRTTNEDDVEAVLASAGFETVLPGRLPLRDQAAMFCEAAAIVGTGAGLFNMVFAPTGARVLQFQEPSHMVHALWTEAEALGHEYHYLLGDTVPNPHAGDADIRVPLDDLRDSLRALASD